MTDTLKPKTRRGYEDYRYTPPAPEGRLVERSILDWLRELHTVEATDVGRLSGVVLGISKDA